MTARTDPSTQTARRVFVHVHDKVDVREVGKDDPCPRTCIDVFADLDLREACVYLLGLPFLLSILDRIHSTWRYIYIMGINTHVRMEVYMYVDVGGSRQLSVYSDSKYCMSHSLSRHDQTHRSVDRQIDVAR